MTRHGTETGYNHYRCRCTECRAANVTGNQRRRRRRAQQLVADPALRPHGVYDTYNNYCCRCDACRLANAERVTPRTGRAT